ncbi:MAG: biopolymer transporter ExbD [Verrucomicrobia bacterium]|nr:biopolymer transporter ExbD [Verrucomicrobiota bacterium]
MHLGSPLSVKKARVEIIPLIDVMFFLLAAFMMVTLTMNRLRTLQMDLPSAVAPKSSEKPDIMEIVIEREGDLKVGGKLLPFSELTGRVEAKVASNTNYPFYLKPDFQTSHGNVLRVLDTIKAAGGNKVSMAIDVTGADRK